MKARHYAILSRAIEDGVTYGYRRAFKHTDEPEEQAILDCVREAVVSAVCEVYSFDDEVES